jgi:hypothetical protein
MPTNQRFYELKILSFVQSAPHVEKVRNYYVRSTDIMSEIKKRQEETEDRLRELENLS